MAGGDSERGASRTVSILHKQNGLDFTPRTLIKSAEYYSTSGGGWTEKLNGHWFH
jgi:hypothetical protein